MQPELRIGVPEFRHGPPSDPHFRFTLPFQQKNPNEYIEIIIASRTNASGHNDAILAHGWLMASGRNAPDRRVRNWMRPAAARALCTRRLHTMPLRPLPCHHIPQRALSAGIVAVDEQLPRTIGRLQRI